MKALIIEDEIPAAERLRNILASVDASIEVIAACNSVESSVKWLKENKAPDVIFMDIELSDGRSFEIFKHVSISSKIIFITAYDDFAIKAIKLNALDYLLKPVDKEELTEALKKLAIQNPNATNGNEEYSELSNSFEKISEGKKPKRLVIHDINGARFISIDKIMRLKADSNYTNIYVNDAEPIVSSRTLKYYEELLSSLGFFRVSNAYLINLTYVEKYIKGIGGEIVMTDGATIEVSRQRKKELLDVLSINQ
jgi:two-component system LytT family response regulator